MKNFLFKSFMAVAAMMTVGMFTSCSNDEEELLPDVIESEVVEEGISNNVTSSTTSKNLGQAGGTELSYESWITVTGQTRAAFENKVSVTLTNVFNNTDSVIYVENYKMSGYRTSTRYDAKSSRKDGFVTVTDSVMVYVVAFDNFSFEYQLDYEKAVYNDGVTKQVMPSYTIGKIKDNGYTVTDIDSKVIEDYAVAQKKLSHSISVEFNGKTYELKASVLLLSKLGSANAPYIVRSQFMAKDSWKSADHILASVVNRRQVWSDGTVNNTPVACYFGYEDETDFLTPAVVTLSGFDGELTIKKTELSDGFKELSGKYDEYVDVYITSYSYRISYDEFEIAIPVSIYGGVYNDGVLYEELTVDEFEKIEVSKPVLYFENSGGEEGARYNVYWLTQSVTFTIKGVSFTRSGQVQIVAYE